MRIMLGLAGGSAARDGSVRRTAIVTNRVSSVGRGRTVESLTQRDDREEVLGSRRDPVREGGPHPGPLPEYRAREEIGQRKVWRRSGWGSWAVAARRRARAILPPPAAEGSMGEMAA